MKKKCNATGKSLFNSRNDALIFIYVVKKRIKKLVNGRRRKHHMGKPALKRTYHCPHCGKYHVTSWSEEEWIARRKEKENDRRMFATLAFNLEIMRQFEQLLHRQE